MAYGLNDVFSTIQWPNIYVLGRLVQEFEVNIDKLIGSKHLAVVDGGGSNIFRWDLKSGVRGMVKPSSMRALPRNVGGKTVKSLALESGYFKETTTLDEADLLLIAKKPSQSLAQRAAEDLVTEKASDENKRLETLLEWMRWQTFQGSLRLLGDGVDRTIDYLIPAANKIDLSGDANNRWTNVNAPIRKQLGEWRNLFRFTGAGNPIVYMNRITLSTLMQNVGILDLVQRTTLVTQIGIEQIRQLVMPLVGGLGGIEEYDEAYVADDGTKTPFIPDGYVILIAQGEEPIGDIPSAPSLYGNASIDEPNFGKFPIFKAEIGEGVLLPQVTVGTGIYCIPRLHHPEWVVVVKVF